MRHYTIIYSLIYVATFALSGCNKFLEVKTYDKVLPKTVEDHATLVYARLNDLESKQRGLHFIGNSQDAYTLECFGDNMNASLDSNPSSMYYVGTYVTTSQYRFMNHYGVIKDCNILLDHLRDKDLGEEYHELKAVALTMRATAYFDLVRENCDPVEPGKAESTPGVPIVSEFDLMARPGRGTLGETLDFMEQDLRQAIALNQTNQELLLTVDVAQFYLVRVLFWAQKYDDVITEAEKYLDKHPLISGNDYREMMLTTLGKPKGNVILAPFNKGTSLRPLTTNLRKQATRPISVEFARSFAEGDRDIRYALTMDSRKLKPTKLPFIRLRSAEIYLDLVEALAHTGNESRALELLNTFRRKRIKDYEPWTSETLPRASSCGVITQDATGKPLTPLMCAILCERRKEFFNEGDRWWELKRNGRPVWWVANQGRKYTTEKYLYSYPLWINDLKSNPLLKQNPGYENQI